MTHMKTKFRHILYGALLLAAMLGNMQTAKAQGSVSLDVFYSELAPYGTWITDAQYGYIWVPNVAQGFQPYATNGYWVMTDYGNTWVSDYSWGLGSVSLRPLVVRRLLRMGLDTRHRMGAGLGSMAIGRGLLRLGTVRSRCIDQRFGR